MIEIVGTNAYPVAQWAEALEQAEANDFCPIDTREDGDPETGALGAWLIDELRGIELKEGGALKGDDRTVTEEIIEAALDAFGAQERGDLTPDGLLKVVRSYNGETEDDFEKLARDYAETDYIGPEEDNPANREWAEFVTEADYEKWYTDNAIGEGEVCGMLAVGGTLIWFDKNQW